MISHLHLKAVQDTILVLSICLQYAGSMSIPSPLVGMSADEQLMPLLGKRIMITAPRQYASKLASCLITAGARPVWLPSISITRISDQKLGAVSKTWLLFGVKTVVFSQNSGAWY